MSRERLRGSADPRRGDRFNEINALPTAAISSMQHGRNTSLRCLFCVRSAAGAQLKGCRPAVPEPRISGTAGSLTQCFRRTTVSGAGVISQLSRAQPVKADAVFEAEIYNRGAALPRSDI